MQTTAAIGDRLRAMSGAHWLGLYGVVLAAWAALFAMAVPGDLAELGGVYGAEFWAALCGFGAEGARWSGLFVMWSLMSAAMMAPTALPAFAVFDDLQKGDGGRGFALLLAGYMAVWLGFAAVAAWAQLGLAGVGLVDPLGASTSQLLTAGLLIGAGLYQFSALKEACLAKCRAPFAFFMAHWNEGPLRNGLRLGAVCLGCCWALMALAFVGGTMSLAFMGLATVLMALEKLPDIGRWISRPLGLGLVAAGGMTLALAG